MFFRMFIADGFEFRFIIRISFGYVFFSSFSVSFFWVSVPDPLVDFFESFCVKFVLLRKYEVKKLLKTN